MNNLVQIMLKRGILVTIIFLITPITSSAQLIRCPSSPYEPNLPNDTMFVVDCGSDLDVWSYGEQSWERFIIPIEVTRYVGPVNAEGYLIDPDKLIDGVAISKYAELEIMIYDVNTFPDFPWQYGEVDQVYVNDEFVGECWGDWWLWKSNTFKVPIGKLKFPDEGADEPAINIIRIEIDVLNEGWETEVDWASLSFFNIRPILMVHGFMGSESVWDNVWKRNLNFRGVINNSVSVGVLSETRVNGRIISAEITDECTRYGVDNINIAGHSKGGLDSRVAILGRTDVDHLYMVGTPNLGSPLADLAQDYITGLPFPWLIPWGIVGRLAAPGLHELTTFHMRRTFNENVLNNGNTRYITMAGNYVLWAGWQGAPYLDPVNDWVVEASSVHGLGYAQNHLFETYGWDDGAFHTQQIDYSWEPFDFLFGSNGIFMPFSCPSEPINQPVPLSSETPNISQRTEIITDFILPLDSKSHSINIEQAEQVIFYCLWGLGDIDLVLRDPMGTIIDSLFASTVDSINFTSTELFDGINIETYTFNQDPLAGSWIMEVTADSFIAGGDYYGLGAAYKGADISINASPDKGYYQNNDDMILSVVLQDGENPVLGANVFSQVMLPDSTIDTLVLYDDGSHGDFTADDGTYVNVFNNTLEKGYYRIIHTANQSGINAFSRKYSTVVTVSAGGSTLGKLFEDAVVDIDQDGLYDYLNIRFDVDITNYGEYSVSGGLFDQNSNQIGYFAIDTIFQTGVHTLIASFDGFDIFSNGIDGPYQFMQVSLTELDSSNALLVNHLDLAHASQAYGHRSFQRPKIFLTGNSSDNAIDVDSDGLFDSLSFNIEVDLIESDYYEWCALLFDSTRNVIGSTSNGDSLSSGISTINVAFGGIEIGESGVDGPYLLGGFHMHGDTSASAAIQSLAYSDSYRYTEFEGASIPYWGGHVTGNFILDHEVILNEDLIIDSSGILTINPGVTVYVLPDSQISILNYGSLVAKGTSSDGIRFSSWIAEGDTAYHGDWYGINTVSGGNLLMDYCELFDADYGVKATEPSAFIVDNSTIANNMTAGIYIKTPPLATTISNTRIDSSGTYGIYCIGGTIAVDADTISECSYGIKYVGAGELAVTNCTITNSSMGSGGTYYGVHASNLSTMDLDVTIDNSRIRGFDQGGVYFYGVSSSGYIRDTFTDTTGVYGIYFSDSDAGIIGSPSSYNRTSGNTYGLYLTKYSAPEVRRTKFWDNTSYGAYVKKLSPADFGQNMLGDYGENSFKSAYSGILYKDIYSAEIGFTDAYRNYWGEPIPDTLEIVGANYIPYLGIDPLLKIGLHEDDINIPEDFELASSYPNPFNSSTVIRYNLKSPNFVSIKIYNIMGQQVRALFDGRQNAGIHTIIWDGKNSDGNSISAGVYLCQLQTTEKQRTLKMTVLK